MEAMDWQVEEIWQLLRLPGGQKEGGGKMPRGIQFFFPNQLSKEPEVSKSWHPKVGIQERIIKCPKMTSEELGFSDAARRAMNRPARSVASGEATLSSPNVDLEHSATFGRFQGFSMLSH